MEVLEGVVKMSENLDAVWEKCLNILQVELNDELTYENMFLDSSLVELENNTAYIILNSTIAVGSATANRDLIERCLNQVTETNYKCEFLTQTHYDNLNSRTLFDQDSVEGSNQKDNLMSNFRFENFVVGDSNRESYQAGLAVSNNPGMVFNPLFIYGKSGLGKTHILNSIGNRIKQQKPNMRILYVTSEEFFNNYMELVNKKKDDEWFNKKYRDIDVLLIDDIQFLGGKQKSSTMLFNIYNDLFNRNKQIIITSDVIPSKLAGLENRLVSRFSQGLSVSITPPEYETSLKILQAKLSYLDQKVAINDEALDYMAKNFSNDIRKLEGALNRLIFFTIDLNDTNEIDLKTVKKAFKDYEIVKENGDITPDKIMNTVISYYNLTKSQILGKSRTKGIAYPRHIAIYLTRELLDTPYEKIGQSYGNRDHSTVMSSYHKINELINDNDHNIIIVINELKELLKS